jgi:hypothetical protein
LGLNSAVARLKRLLGASGRIVAYLLERCGSEAAQLCAQRRRFGFCLLVWFFVSKVSEASQGGVEGILESYGPATLDAAFTPLAVSQSLLFGLARGAHRRLRRERTPQYSSRSPRRTYWLLRWSKTSPHTAHQRALLERLFSHPKVRSHDSSTVSATRATTSLGCGIRSATAASVGARIRPNRQ